MILPPSSLSRPLPAPTLTEYRSATHGPQPLRRTKPPVGCRGQEFPREAKDLDGIVILDKPTGITSAKAVYRVRAITGVRKSGHAGTLDPGATGVLLVCQGKATRLVEAVMDLPKVYRAHARLDVTSESFDADRPMSEVPVTSPPSLDGLHAACALFEGVIAQVPPHISAIKLGGIPSYRRRAEDAHQMLTARPVRIHWLVVRAYEWPTVEFDMACGRGTYVRALIRDLGQRLGTGGCLTALRRLAVGPFHEREAVGFEELASDPAAHVIELERARTMIEAGRGVVPARV